jgi:hypothetical protein
MPTPPAVRSKKLGMAQQRQRAALVRRSPVTHPRQPAWHVRRTDEPGNRTLPNARRPREFACLDFAPAKGGGRHGSFSTGAVGGVDGHGRRCGHRGPAGGEASMADPVRPIRLDSASGYHRRSTSPRHQLPWRLWPARPCPATSGKGSARFTTGLHERWPEHAQRPLHGEPRCEVQLQRRNGEDVSSATLKFALLRDGRADPRSVRCEMTP